MSKARRARGRRALAGALCALALGVGAAPAQAGFSDPLFVFTPGPGGAPASGFEGPCGLAVDGAGRFYVSDYYHHAVDIFASSQGYEGQLEEEDPLDGPCGLALDSAGNLYVNNFHRNVAKFSPSLGAGPVLDSAHPTGVAVDPTSDDLYINDRTYIAAYDSSGAALPDGEGHPLKIGLGSLGDGYGLAVSGYPGTAGRLYVPDAATDTVEVYDPALDKDNPVATIHGPGGSFVSLRDAAVAVDAQNGNVYVADNQQPTYTEAPQAAIYVFGPLGAYLGRLKYNILDALPPGLAVDNSGGSTQGRVYVTSGNTDHASVYAYPPNAQTATALAPLSAPPLAPLGEGAGASAAGGGCAAPCAAGPHRGEQAGASTIAQKGTLRVTVSGKLAPRALPRDGAAPIAVTVGGKISTTDESPPPQLQRLRIEINRHGRLDYAGLPTCPYERIQPASSSRALAACRSALVGRGSFAADIALGGQEPYPTRGRLLVFNGKSHGRQVLFGQIYAPHPFATSFVIVFAIQRLAHGPYGVALSASLPKALGSWGNLTGIEMTLSRRYAYRGRRHSFLSAGCPAPAGFPGAVFSLARTSFGFAGGQELDSVLDGSCKVAG